MAESRPAPTMGRPSIRDALRRIADEHAAHASSRQAVTARDGPTQSGGSTGRHVAAPAGGGTLAGPGRLPYGPPGPMDDPAAESAFFALRVGQTIRNKLPTFSGISLDSGRPSSPSDEGAAASSAPGRASAARRLLSSATLRRATVITALVVVAELAAGLGVRARRAAIARGGAAEPTASSANRAPAEPSEPVVAPAPLASADPADEPPLAAARPLATGAEADLDPGALPRDAGYLRVDAPPGLAVYVNGKRAGAPGAALRVPCGRRISRPRW
jgi:hypothetical protein